MADHLSEEEQIEAIKAWWKDNWLLIVVPVVVLSLGYGSWSFYTSNKEARAQEASDEYQLLLKQLEDSGASPNDQQISEIRDSAAEIANDYAGSLYADMSNLLLAKYDVEAKNLSSAETRLRTVVNDAASDAMESLAKIRLAKVLVDQDKADDALSLVATTDQEAYKAKFAETRGDIFYKKGDMAAAKTAYEEAIESLLPSQQARRNLIQLKLDGTKVTWSTVSQQDSTTQEATEVTVEGES